VHSIKLNPVSIRRRFRSDSERVEESLLTPSISRNPRRGSVGCWTQDLGPVHDSRNLPPRTRHCSNGDATSFNNKWTNPTKRERNSGTVRSQLRQIIH